MSKTTNELRDALHSRLRPVVIDTIDDVEGAAVAIDVLDAIVDKLLDPRETVLRMQLFHIATRETPVGEMLRKRDLLIGSQVEQRPEGIHYEPVPGAAHTGPVGTEASRADIQGTSGSAVTPP